MYLTLILSLAEMSAAIPAAGGRYSFVRQAMGSTGGYLTGLAALIEYTLAPGMGFGRHYPFLCGCF